MATRSAIVAIGRRVSVIYSMSVTVQQRDGRGSVPCMGWVGLVL